MEEYQLLKIGELAKLSGVSIKALGVYEKKKIIKPVKVDEETGYRYYSAGQMEMIESLLELQDMGFTLSEIEKVLSGKSSKDELSEIFDRKKDELQDRIWKTEARLKELEILKENLGKESGIKAFNEMDDDERARTLAKLIRVNEENVRQVLSEVVWL